MISLQKYLLLERVCIANAGVTYKMFRSLADEKINILAISTSEIKISVLIREDLTQKGSAKFYTKHLNLTNN